MGELRDHLKRVLCPALEKLKAGIETAGKCCALKSLDFSAGSPDYANADVQRLYVLRYYGAYLCEYRRIYEAAIRHVGPQVRAVSAGAGIGVDLAGLCFACGADRGDTASLKYNVVYRGYDVVAWQDQVQVPGVDARIYTRSIIDLENSAGDANVILFPKSIGDIDTATLDGFVRRLAEIRFSNARLAVASSARATSMGEDIERFKKVVGALLMQGYQTGDDLSSYCGFDPVSWTPIQRRIRCWTWNKIPKPETRRSRAGVDYSRTSSGPERSDWCSTRGRVSHE